MWKTPEEIDWDQLKTGLLRVVQAAFRRIASDHPGRLVRDVTVAWRLEDGIVIEPCVTFSDGEYFNAAVHDRQLLMALEPFDFCLNRIAESLTDQEEVDFHELQLARTAPMLNEIFQILDQENFGLTLTADCRRTLKEF